MLQREITDKRFQVDALDGLRGMAALIVVFAHSSNIGLHLLPGLTAEGMGKSGVFMFFLLSAYLLTLPMLNMGEKIFSQAHLSLYWQRRSPRRSAR